MDGFIELFSNFGELKWQMVVMWIIGAILIYLAIKKDMEPALLLPMGGAILVNIPWSGLSHRHTKQELNTDLSMFCSTRVSQ